MPRIIEIISKDKRYRKEPYPAMAFESSAMNTFLTGQHVVPGNDDTLDFLTADEMRKKTPLTGKRKEKFPIGCIISPDEKILIKHRDKLDISLIDETKPSIYPGDYKYPNQYAKYRFYLEQDVVAKSEDEYNPQKHYFILIDKAEVTKKTLNSRDIKFEAEKFIREQVTQEQYHDMALLLNYKIPSVDIKVKVLTDSDVKVALFDAVDKYPEIVLSLNPKVNSNVNEELFVLKLIDRGLITFSNGVYSDNGKLLGASMGDVLRTFATDELIRAKFARLLNPNKAVKETVPSQTMAEKKDVGEIIKPAMDGLESPEPPITE